MNQASIGRINRPSHFSTWFALGCAIAGTCWFQSTLTSRAEPTAESAEPSTTRPAAASASQPAKLAWTLIYVMSYDNDLDMCTQVILDGLRSGVGPGVAVTVLSDRPGPDGLVQHRFHPAGDMSVRLKSDDITDQAVLRAFLDWSVSTCPAERYCVVFLNHGGALNQMCLDLCLDKHRQGMYWMEADATGRTLQAWRKALPGGQVPLLFLQQCGRGSLENLLNFPHVADYVLYSQTNVGAPNTYYTAFVKSLRAKPQQSGLDAARTIMTEDEHYMTYSVLDSAGLPELHSKLEPVLDALLAQKSLGMPDDIKVTFHCGSPEGDEMECNVDLAEFLVRLCAANGVPKALAEPFNTWMREKLLVETRYRRPQAKKSLRWCGLSCHLPQSADAFGQYARLPAYDGTKWGQVMRRLTGADASTSKPAESAR